MLEPLGSHINGYISSSRIITYHTPITSMSEGKLNLCQAWWPKWLALKNGHPFPTTRHKRSFSGEMRFHLCAKCSSSSLSAMSQSRFAGLAWNLLCKRKRMLRSEDELVCPPQFPFLIYSMICTNDIIINYIQT